MTYTRMEKEAYVDRLGKLQEFCTEHLGTMSEENPIAFLVKENALTDEAIINTLYDFSASLVVMGTKGKNLLKDLLEGSNTKGLIKRSPCPVLVVPPDLERFSLQRLTYATDFEGYDVSGLKWLIDNFARPFGAYLHVLHMNTLDLLKGEELMVRFRAYLEERVSYDHIGFEIIHTPNIYTGLESYLERKETDMLALLERSDLNAIRHTDLINRMVSKVQIPLLSINVSNFP